MSVDPRVDIGHVHLKVADIDRSLAFYRDILGFDVMQRIGDEAAFLSAGGYHHHLGLNTWNGPGAPPPPPGAIGLERFELVTTADAVTAAAGRLREAGTEVSSENGQAHARDPAGIAVEIRAPDVV